MWKECSGGIMPLSVNKKSLIELIYLDACFWVLLWIFHGRWITLHLSVFLFLQGCSLLLRLFNSTYEMPHSHFLVRLPPRWTPYGNTKCIICKQQVHQNGKYCHTCAYSKGENSSYVFFLALWTLRFISFSS